MGTRDAMSRSVKPAKPTMFKVTKINFPNPSKNLINISTISRSLFINYKSNIKIKQNNNI